LGETVKVAKKEEAAATPCDRPSNPFQMRLEALECSKYDKFVILVHYKFVIFDPA